MEIKVPHAESNLWLMTNTIKNMITNRNGWNVPIILKISSLSCPNRKMPKLKKHMLFTQDNISWDCYRIKGIEQKYLSLCFTSGYKKSLLSFTCLNFQKKFDGDVWLININHIEVKIVLISIRLIANTIN